MNKLFSKNMLLIGAFTSTALLLSACSSTAPAKHYGSTYSYTHSHVHPGYAAYSSSSYSKSNYSKPARSSSSMSNSSNADDVQVYFSNRWLPKHYTVVGNISVTNPLQSDSDQRTISDRLRAKASAMGANGVIDVKKGQTQTTAKAIIIK